MKKLSFYPFVALLMGVLFFTACENSDYNGPGLEDENSILPDQLTVDIPAALLEDVSSLKGAPVVDTLKGREIYGHLRFFIHSGAHGSRIVKHIIYGIRRYNIDQVKTVTYESEDDGRIKNLVVVEGPEFDGRTGNTDLPLPMQNRRVKLMAAKACRSSGTKTPKKASPSSSPITWIVPMKERWRRLCFESITAVQESWVMSII